jgi:predicted transcriptional regulator
MNKAEEVPYETAVLILLTLSRGAESRKKILSALLPGPKNCNQLSRETGLDWWTVKKHLLSLMKESLIHSSAFGNSTFYKLSLLGEEAIRALQSSSGKNSDLKSSGDPP